MATTKFYLKTPNDQNSPSLIFLFFNYDGRRLKYSTGEKALPKYWNESTMKVRRSYTGSLELNMHLEAIQAKVQEIYRKYRIKGDIPSPEELRNELKEAFKKNPKTKLTFFSVIDLFIASRQIQVSERTISKYNTLKAHLLHFQKLARYTLSFDSINLSFYDRFLQFCLEELDMVNNSVGKYITTLKVFLNWASERGYNDNFAYKRFKVPKEESDIVYLEYEELMQLFNFDFSMDQRLERIRDAFCLCCFTGIRYSDLAGLKVESIKGDHMIIKVFKTKTTLRIPLNEYAKSILDKYLKKERFLDVVSNQKMNKNLKNIAKIAGIDAPVVISKMKGTERIESVQPKHELISTHTGRRTFVTLSLEKGMRPEVAMKITGHKSYEAFKKYIKIIENIKDAAMKETWD